VLARLTLFPKRTARLIERHGPGFFGAPRTCGGDGRRTDARHPVLPADKSGKRCSKTARDLQESLGHPRVARHLAMNLPSDGLAPSILRKFFARSVANALSGMRQRWRLALAEPAYRASTIV